MQVQKSPIQLKPPEVACLCWEELPRPALSIGMHPRNASAGFKVETKQA